MTATRNILCISLKTDNFGKGEVRRLDGFRVLVGCNEMNGESVGLAKNICLMLKKNGAVPCVTDGKYGQAGLYGYAGAR